MTEPSRTRLKTIAAPYGREVRLDEIAYPSGMKLLRVTIREGARYTILELDPACAREWGQEMASWANATSAEPSAEKPHPC